MNIGLSHIRHTRTQGTSLVWYIWANIGICAVTADGPIQRIGPIDHPGNEMRRGIHSAGEAQMTNRPNRQACCRTSRLQRLYVLLFRKRPRIDALVIKEVG